MKKNGRKYRKTQRGKEIKKNRIGNLRTHICQEVNGINTAYFSMARTVTHNPIIINVINFANQTTLIKSAITRGNQYWHICRFSFGCGGVSQTPI